MSTYPRYVYPLDPSCPDVEHAFMIPVPTYRVMGRSGPLGRGLFHDEAAKLAEVSGGTVEEDGGTEWIDDPYASMCGDELYEDFERKHRAKCARCREYGAANVDVDCG